MLKSPSVGGVPIVYGLSDRNIISLCWCSYDHITRESSVDSPPTIENDSSSPPGRSGDETVPLIVRPLKSFLVIMFTTPPIASEP